MSTRLTLSEQLHYAVAKYAEKMGEGWRINEGSEIMDSLQAHQEMLGVLNKIHPDDLKDCSLDSFRYDFDKNEMRVLCSSCARIIKFFRGDLLKLFRKEVCLEMTRQYHLKLPWRDITITIWSKSKPVLPRVFIR